jgi:hypothetical protein
MNWNGDGIGSELKEQMTEPGDWSFWLGKLG